jgi:hypothetical protein
MEPHFSDEDDFDSRYAPGCQNRDPLTNLDCNICSRCWLSRARCLFKITPRPSPPRRNQIEVDIVHTLRQDPKILFLQIIRTGPPTFNNYWLRKPNTERPTPFDKRVTYQQSLTPNYYKPIPPVVIEAGNGTLEGWEDVQTKDGTIIQALASRDHLDATDLPAVPIVLINVRLDEYTQLLEDLASKTTSLGLAAATKHQAEIVTYEARITDLEKDVTRLLPLEEQTSKHLVALESLRKSQETLLKSKEAYKTRGDTYKNRAETAESKVKTLEMELSASKKQLADAQTVAAKASGHKCPPQTDRPSFEKLKADYKVLDARCQRYRRERDDTDREMSTLRSSEDRLRNQVASLQRQGPFRPEEKRQRLDQPALVRAPAPAAPEPSETWNQLEKTKAELAKERERNEKILSSMDNLKESLKSEITIGIREQVLKQRERESSYGAPSYLQRPYF